MQAATILLVEDHAVFRCGLQWLLEQAGSRYALLQARDADEGLALLQREAAIDLVLLDLNLPGMDGLTLLARMRELRPALPVLLISAHEGRSLLLDAMRRGARGFLPKTAPPAQFVEAIDAVLSGQGWWPLPPGTPETAAAPTALTARQREVLERMADGCSNKDIADALGMRVNTVRVHVAAILRTLQVDSRDDAAQAALRLGILERGR